jgi:REP-associated tyrosine transposase
VARGPLKPGSGLSGDVHLLSEPHQDTLADALKSLKQGVSRRLVGDRIISGKRGITISTFEITRSLWRNCAISIAIRVKRGLCECAEEWQWSSFRHYATGCEGRVEIESEWTARKRERAAGRLCPAIKLPHSSQNRA